MRRIDKYDLNSIEGLQNFMSDVRGCLTDHKDGESCVYECSFCKAKYLLEEIPTKKVKRYELYNGDFVKAEADYDNYAEKWRFPKYKTFGEWLMADVEVEE